MTINDIAVTNSSRKYSVKSRKLATIQLSVCYSYNFKPENHNYLMC